MDRTLLCETHGYGVWNVCYVVVGLALPCTFYPMYAESGEMLHLGAFVLSFIPLMWFTDTLLSVMIVETDASTLYIRPKNKITLKKSRTVKKVDIQEVIVQTIRGRDSNAGGSSLPSFPSFHVETRLINGDTVELLEAPSKEEADRISGLIREAT